MQRGATYLSSLSLEGGHGNQETLLELLASFFAFGSSLLGGGAWGHSDPALCRQVGGNVL